MRIKPLILLVMTSLIVFTSLTFTFALYYTQKHALLKGIDDKLLTSARLIHEILPPNYHDKIVDKNSVSPEEYKRIVMTFDKLCLKLDLQYLWSVLVVDDKVVFSSATSPSKNIKNHDHAHFFEAHTNPQAFDEAFSTMQVSFSSFHNRWGHGRMVLVPERDAKGRKFCFGASMSLEKVNALVARTFRAALLVGTALLFAGIVVTIALANFLSGPIQKLTQVAESIATGHFDLRATPKGSSELKSLAQSINEMSTAIQSKMFELQRLATIIESTSDLVGIVTLDKKHTFMNAAGRRLLGWQQDEDISKKHIQDAHPKWAFEKVQNQGIPAAVRDGIWEGENAFIGPEGQEIPIYQIIMAHKNALGELEFISTVVRDLTEQKKTEKELRELAENLARSNKELEQFAYVASHDLQEPLRTIVSYTELLKHRYGDKLDSDADDFINFTVSAAHRMQNLIRALLEYSRVESRGSDFGEVDCNRALKESLSNLSIAVKESKAKITCNELPVIKGDHSQIVQLFQNLLGNALKFHGDKPPKVHISAQPGDSSTWVISIQDNGIGIAKEFQERIFTIFRRLHTSSQYEGTGIGLSVCKKIVERHGGRIWVESEPEKGAAFFFTLST